MGVVIGHSLGKRTHYSGASADAFFFLILVLAPVLIGRVVRARSQLANSLREATERLKAARSERLAAGLAADRAQLSESIDAALLDGLGRMVEHAECETPAQVSALERIARELLGRLRGLLKDLRAGEEALRPGGSISELHARVQRAIEADAALRSAPSAAKASPRRGALVSPRVIDAALAAVALVLTAGLLASTLGAHTLRGTRWGDALLAVAVAAPIAWARRFAVEAAVTSVAATLTYIAVAAPADPGSGWLPTATVIVLPLAIGATCPARKAIAGLALCLAVAAFGDAIDPAARFDPVTIGPALALVVGAWAAGRVLRDRGRMLERLADTAAGIEDEREQLASAARTAERTRVARELHDAVAHAMTVIVLQAGAARRVWSSDPALASEHTATLRKTVSELITELRAMMVALAGGEQAGIDQLDRLLERAGASGMHVDLDVNGDREALSPELEHTAYRVLQEALTNAARHAPGTDIRVRLDFARVRPCARGRQRDSFPTGTGGEWTRAGAQGNARTGRSLRRAARDRHGATRQVHRPRLAAEPMTTIRVLLADDQPLVLAGLRTILESEPDIEIVGQAQDGRTAVALARELRPDLVLMDIRMPQLDGLAATRELAVEGTGDEPVRVVVLTTFDLDEYVYEALRAGASGFLVKDLPDHELIAGVRAAAGGDTMLAPSVTQRLIDTYTQRPPNPTLPAGADELTPRELEVWHLVARGLSNAEIAAELVIGEATVKTHVARIISKLGVRDRIQAIVLAYESGLR